MLSPVIHQTLKNYQENQMCLIFKYSNSIHIFCTFIYTFSINIISVNFLIPFFFAYLLNTYLIAAREKFQILKNGSDCQGAWPPLVYNFNRLHWQQLCNAKWAGPFFQI